MKITNTAWITIYNACGNNLVRLNENHEWDRPSFNAGAAAMVGMPHSNALIVAYLAA